MEHNEGGESSFRGNSCLQPDSWRITVTEDPLSHSETASLHESQAALNCCFWSFSAPRAPGWAAQARLSLEKRDNSKESSSQKEKETYQGQEAIRNYTSCLVVCGCLRLMEIVFQIIFASVSAQDFFKCELDEIWVVSHYLGSPWGRQIRRTANCFEFFFIWMPKNNWA